MKILDVIKYEGDNQTFIWKHPSEDFNTSSQLIVHESQEAILFVNGVMCDSFGPGKHTLETQNIPGSRSICFVVEKSKAYYLRTFIKGESLISERFINNPDILIETIVNVIEKIRKIDSTNCKIKSTDNIGNSFTIY